MENVSWQRSDIDLTVDLSVKRTMEPPIALTILPFLLAIFIFAAGYIVGKRDKRNLLLSD